MLTWILRGWLLCVVVLCSVPSAHALSNEAFQALHTFSRVLHDIANYYVEPVDEEKLVEGAMQGMLEALDPHSAYLEPQVYKALRSETGGRFSGVGIEITLKQGWITVVSPIDDSPAARAGIKPGDRIVKINGKSTKQMNIGDAVKEMRGSQGSKVVLTIMRVGSRTPMDVALRRERIQVLSVRGELLAPGYPYIRLTGFQEQTYEDLLAALREYSKQGAIRGLILDLRNNPGGLLEQAVSVSDLFIRDGVILTTVSRGKEVDRREAHGSGTEPEYPIVILVNGGSASAAEIVAGALQDHKRALVIGSQTFGKGSVQTVIEMDDGSALKLTIARYYTPSKRSIQAFGIPPDVIVPEESPRATPKAETGEEKTAPLTEASLPGHLKGRGKHHKTRSAQRVRLPEVHMKAGDIDYQRAVALALLENGTAARLTGRRGFQP